MKPTVGVFVPCYNYARFLEDCVRSILDQSGVDVSVLIIDDASTDRTPEVGARLVLDDRVEYRRHATNKGHLATYNEGIEWASRQYTVLLSADDLLTDGSLERATTALETNPEAGFAYGRVLIWHDDQSKPTPRPTGGPVPFEVRTGGDWIESVCKDGRNHIFSPEVVVRTSVQKEVGGYRPDLPHAGDMEMWLRIAARSSVVILQSDQAYYRVHGKNMHEPTMATSADLEQRRLVFDVIFREQADRLNDVDQLRSTAYHSLVRESWIYASGLIEKSGSRSNGLDIAKYIIRSNGASAFTSTKVLGFAARMALGPHAFARLRRTALGWIGSVSK